MPHLLKSSVAPMVVKCTTRKGDSDTPAGVHTDIEGADTEDTAGAGGKMGSWLADMASGATRGYGKVFSKMSEYSVPGLAMKATGIGNPISDFYEREFVDKADLRGAEAVSFASGLPIVGGLVRGVEGVNQLEDLYNRTGKVPAYPGASGVGAQGMASALGQVLNRKIEDGQHDLGVYYSGDAGLNRNVNGHMSHSVVKSGTGKISKYGGF